MLRRFAFCNLNRIIQTSLLAWTIVLLAPGSLLAQDGSIHSMVRGGGGYLSLIKLSLIAVAFLIWVRYADWVNRDSMKLGEDTGLTPEVWNPINVGSFLVGFFAVISIPIFIAGYPFFLVAAFTGPVVYSFMRRGKVKSDPGLALKAKAKPNQVADLPVLPQDEGAEVDFVAAGETDEDRQVNLIRARQTKNDGFNNAKELIEQSLKKRSDLVVLDFTREKTAGRTQIDGSWHPLPPMDRPTGDAILASLKFLAGLNPQDRKSQQQGVFRAITPIHKCDLELVTRGTPSGERAQMKFVLKLKKRMSITQLGMWPQMSKQLEQTMNSAGLVIISSPPSQGLTATWQAALEHTDRVTRDCVALIDVHETQSDVENIALHKFDVAARQSPATIMKRVLLTQPDCLIIPDVVNSHSLDLLTHEAVQQNRSVITRINANTAAEALLRLYSMSKNRRQFAQAVTAVTNQRLLRRLCDQCKTEVPVKPKMIQQLGGDPREQTTIYMQYRLPPPEQRVDAKGKPIEFPPCEVCGGIGYIGRIAVFESIFVTDSIRKTLISKPNAEAIEKTARAEGQSPLLAQGYKLVLHGLTSIQEVQRVMKE